MSGGPANPDPELLRRLLRAKDRVSFTSACQISTSECH